MGKARLVLSLLLLLVAASLAEAAGLFATPADYKTKLLALQPGDTLHLAAGDYPDGMSVSGLNGTAASWITITGPTSGAPAVFLGDLAASRNTIEIWNSSYVALKNLRIDGQDVAFIDGIKAPGGSSNVSHDILIEGCTIVRHGGHQQTVGISTKCPTWNWTIRGNTIVGAGTGIYLGNSTGSDSFVGGLIEYNLIDDPEGYCMQIKYQPSRTIVAGMPTTPQNTIIRHNVFAKSDRASGDGDRPNLLVGGFPAAGTGSTDLYEIYGNFFFHNPRESLLQAEGRIAIHDNLFVDVAGSAMRLQNHNMTLRLAQVYNNTIYSAGTGISFGVLPSEGHAVVGNLIFAATGISGPVVNLSGNIVDAAGAAGTYVASPSLTLGSMDFFPKTGQCQGPGLDLSAFAAQTAYALDFNGSSKGAATFRGAYAGEGANPGWRLQKSIKDTTAAPPPPADTTPPTGSVAVAGGALVTASFVVDLELSASDAGAGASGMGSGAQMRFSNDGVSWSPAAAYAASLSGWDLSLYGGGSLPGLRTIRARFKDAAGNWSSASITTQIELLASPVPVLPSAGCSGHPGEGPQGSLLATWIFLAPLLWRMRRR
ncbi:MAG: hypothetical protein ACT4PV_11900 [Planctomycetaceae bacterium]